MSDEFGGKLFLSITLPSDDQTVGQISLVNHQKIKPSDSKEELTNDRAIDPPNSPVTTKMNSPKSQSAFQRKLRAKSAVYPNSNTRSHYEVNILQGQCFDLKNIGDSLNIPYRYSPRTFNSYNQKKRPTTAGCISTMNNDEYFSRTSLSTATSSSSKQNPQLKPNVVDINQIFNSFTQYPLKYNNRQPVRLGLNNFSYLTPKSNETGRQYGRFHDIIQLKKPSSYVYNYHRKLQFDRSIINGVNIRRIIPLNKFDKN